MLFLIQQTDISDNFQRYVLLIGAIDPSNSAFKYDAGKNHFDFHNDSYVPRFLDDIDEHLKEKALDVCDSITNIECIFDFAFTENAKIAKENNRIKEKLNEDKMEIGKHYVSNYLYQNMFLVVNNTDKIKVHRVLHKYFIKVKRHNMKIIYNTRDARYDFQN
jgi:hypothetical protein